MLLELPASGGVLPSYVFYTYNLLRYHGTYGTVLAILEGILVGFIIYYIIEELTELARVRLRYFSNFWNIVDTVLLSLCCIEVYLEYNRTKVAAERINEVLENGLTDAPFDDVVATQETFNNIAAVILFLSWIKDENTTTALTPELSTPPAPPIASSAQATCSRQLELSPCLEALSCIPGKNLWRYRKAVVRCLDLIFYGYILHG